MPLYILVIDYILGVIMWTLIGRSAMNIFQREDSQFFFMRVFVKYTNPIIKLFRFITPSFIAGPLVPIYVAWFFYMFRFLFNALFIRLFCNGDAVISIGKRDSSRIIQAFW